jgi:Na+/melibiose symporter-like transporter
LSIAQGIWSGCIIFVSFLWGSLFFKEEMKNVPLTILGLVLLILGVTLIALCKSTLKNDQTSNLTEEFIKENLEDSLILSKNDKNENIKVQNNEKKEKKIFEKLIKILKNSKNTFLGLICCSLTGLLAGY